MDIISIFVFLVIIGLLFWGIGAIAAAFGIPQPIVTVLHVFLVIVVVLWLLSALGLWSGGPVLRLR